MTKQQNHLKRIQRQLLKDIDGLYNPRVVFMTPIDLTDEHLLKIKPENISAIDWLDKTRWILHTLITLKREKRYENKRLVPLDSKVLFKVIGKNYLTYINALTDAGFIKRISLNYSTILHKCYKYELNKKYTKTYTHFYSPTSPSLLSAIRKFLKTQNEELKLKSHPIAHLARWQFDKNLCLDEKLANKFLKKTHLPKLEKAIAKMKLTSKGKEAAEMYKKSLKQDLKSKIKNFKKTKTLILIIQEDYIRKFQT